MSKKTSIRRKLEEDFNIFFTRKELYKALCSYNDRMGRIFTIDELEKVLDAKKGQLIEFADFLLEEFEPEAKFVA